MHRAQHANGRVPRDILDPLTMAIAKRDQVSRIRKLNPYNDAETHASHEHFIDILRKCKNILSKPPAQSRRRKPRSTYHLASAPSQDVSASFMPLAAPPLATQQPEAISVPNTNTSLTAASAAHTSPTQIPPSRESTSSRPRTLDPELNTPRDPSEPRTFTVNKRIPEPTQLQHTSQHSPLLEEEAHPRAYGSRLGNSTGRHISYRGEDSNGKDGPVCSYSKTRKAIVFLILLGALWKLKKHLVGSTGSAPGRPSSRVSPNARWLDFWAPKTLSSLLFQKLSEIDWALPAKQSYALLSRNFRDMAWALPNPSSVLPQRLGDLDLALPKALSDSYIVMSQKLQEMDWSVPKKLYAAVSQKLEEMDWSLPKKSYTAVSQKLGELDQSVLKTSYNLLLQKASELRSMNVTSPISGTETGRSLLELGIRKGLDDVLSFVRGSQS
ncbi:hypothetical protein BDV98DRAFT_575860 [Pterulicium gracile]|uniref:DUF6604 domain-containing protein n=1 Tax=Pterulicium gracile TaxID=1884261 RepID=A0A5C3Q4T7_9AGAR|nr:hypothetical protein BDV98DRAFT_575860 [Pterula gracilis]